MLDINIEFRKGILFIRLEGILNRETVHILNREVLETIEINGIKNILFNLENLYYIDFAGVNAIMEHYDRVISYHGQAFICGITNTIVKNRMIENHVLNYYKEIGNELNAFKITSW